jgi:hypothetical protein
MEPEVMGKVVFTIGHQIKGKTFEQVISDINFIHYVKSEAEYQNPEKVHPEIMDFYKYAKWRGAIV